MKEKIVNWNTRVEFVVVDNIVLFAVVINEWYLENDVLADITEEYIDNEKDMIHLAKMHEWSIQE